MGIRFACHVCEHKLNIKSDLAGRRGICPSCSGRFRIPLQDAEKSTPIEEASDSSAIENDGLANDRDSSGEPAVPTPPDGPPEAAVPRTSQPSQDTVPPPQPATILDDDEDGTWYVRPPSGGQYGPATSELLKEWVGDGRVAATSLLWRDGWPQWRDASEALPELVAELPGNNKTPDSLGLPSANSSMPPSAPAPVQDSPVAKSSKLSGDAEVGTTRRKRTNQRIYLIGFLMGLVALLIAGLIYAVNR